jgi:hypothetical protein
MPEQYQPKRRGSFTLWESHRMGHLIRVGCRSCKKERHFLPDELRTVLGPVEVDDLKYMMKCSGCGSRVEVASESLAAEKRQQVTMRRLVNVYYVRRARWRDEPS